MEVNVCDVIDYGSDPFMCSELTKTIHNNTSLNSQDVETSPIQNDQDMVELIPEDVEPSHTRHIATIPTAGMKFDTEDKLYDYFRAYAYKAGFGVRRSSVRNEGDIKYYAIACDKGGVHKSTNPQSKRTRLVTKKDCKAKVSVIVYDNGSCVISRIFLEHNHALKVEAKGYENLPFGERECRNYIAKVRQLRLGTGDAESLREYFVRMQRRNKNFFYAMDIDDDGRLQNVFCADARSRARYQSFGDVVSFDSTYLTSEYSMPFAPFVGVNHHGQSILFGCGLLLSGEDKMTYAWLFRSWLECMDGRPPKAIITDQCPSMKVAVAEVFPEAHHRLCLWHIMKKIPQKLGGYSEYKGIKKTLKIIVYESVEHQEFEDGWSKMIKDYSLEENEWLCSSFDDRKRWVPVYVKEIFWAGMSTTQRSESMNAFFDGYVNSKRSLRQFVEQLLDYVVVGLASTQLEMTTSSTNNSVFSFFEKQKLTGPKFIDWYRKLRIVLSIEDKLNYLEQPIPPAPAAPAEQELLQTTRDFHSCRQEEGQSVSSYVLKMKGYIDNLERLGHPVTLGLGNHGKRKNKQAYAPKPKIPPPPKREILAKDSICHECGEIGHWERNCPRYLAELLKKKKNAASRAGGSGSKASRKLKPGALSLYVSNGQRESVEAIDAFYLCLPSRLEIVLNNCHYAPSITRGVISVSRLYEDGFVNCFVDNTIQVSRNNVVYFSVVPRDGIFETDLSNSLTNESSIYAVSNKRAKLDLDSALLW
nr:protein FAR-RED impaired response 1-like [Tanacetum cinerariifolium]